MERVGLMGVRPEARAVSEETKNIAMCLLGCATLVALGLLIQGALSWRDANTMVQLDKAKTMAGCGMGLLKLVAAVGLVWWSCSGRAGSDLQRLRDTISS
jgi:hypothetical protein